MSALLTHLKLYQQQIIQQYRKVSCLDFLVPFAVILFLPRPRKCSATEFKSGLLALGQEVILLLQYCCRLSYSAILADFSFFFPFSALVIFCWFLWNASKFPAMMGMGRERTKTPDTAHMEPTNLPKPEWLLRINLMKTHSVAYIHL